MFRSHFKTAFAKTFFIILSSLFIIIFLYYAFFTRISKNIYRETGASTYQNMAENLTSHLDTILKTISDDAVVIAQDVDVLNSLLIPVKDYPDRNYKILQTLKQITEKNPYIDAAEYCINDFGLRFCSSGLITLDGSVRQISNSATQKSGSGCFMRQNNRENRPLEYILNFPLQKQYPMGQITLTLDSSAIWQRIADNLQQEDTYVFLTDKEKNLLFPSETKNVPSTEILNLVHSSHFDETCQEITYRRAHYMLFSSKSVVTDWTCLYLVPFSRIVPIGNLFLTTMIPASLLLILTSLVLAFGASRYLSSPLVALMGTIKNQLSPSLKVETTGDEVDFIKNTYFQILSQNNQLDQIIHHSGPVILHSFYRSLLQGTEPDAAYMDFMQNYFDIKELEKKFHAFIILQIPNIVAESPKAYFSSVAAQNFCQRFSK